MGVPVMMTVEARPPRHSHRCLQLLAVFDDDVGMLRLTSTRLVYLDFYSGQTYSSAERRSLIAGAPPDSESADVLSKLILT